MFQNRLFFLSLLWLQRIIESLDVNKNVVYLGEEDFWICYNSTYFINLFSALMFWIQKSLNLCLTSITNVKLACLLAESTPFFIFKLYHKRSVLLSKIKHIVCLRSLYIGYLCQKYSKSTCHIEVENKISKWHHLLMPISHLCYLLHLTYLTLPIYWYVPMKGTNLR